MNLYNITPNDLEIIHFIEDEINLDERLTYYQDNHMLSEALGLITEFIVAFADTKGITQEEASKIYENYQLSLLQRNLKYLEN